MAITAPFVVAVDNDECIGSFPDLGLLFSLFLHAGRPPPVKVFVGVLEEYSLLRPGLRLFFQTILDMKKEGLVHSIVMCTAASDAIGWVSFLRRVIEEWFGAAVYDHIIDGKMICEWHRRQGTSAIHGGTGALVKDMDHVREVVNVTRDTKVFMMDDRPTAVLNASVIVEVPPYRGVAMDVVEVMERIAPLWWPHDARKSLGSVLSRHLWHLRHLDKFTCSDLDLCTIQHALSWCVSRSSKK